MYFFPYSLATAPAGVEIMHLLVLWAVAYEEGWEEDRLNLLALANL